MIARERKRESEKKYEMNVRSTTLPMSSAAMKGRNARLCKLPQLKAEHGYNVGTFKIQIGGYLVAFLWVKRPFEVAKMKKG